MKHFIAIFLILKVSLSDLPNCQKVQYSYYVLSLTWPNQFCSKNYCNQQKSQKFVGTGQGPLTIHGFWPASTDLSYLSCLAQNDKDPFCFTDFKFNSSLFTKKQLADLNEYWPSLSKKNFWQYEWNKHGTCYLNIIKDQKGSKLNKGQILKQYFMGTVQKARTLDIWLESGSTINSLKDLGDKIYLHPTQFLAICQNKNQLSQIRVCYDINSVPKSQQITTCPKSNDPSRCKFPINVR